MEQAVLILPWYNRGTTMVLPRYYRVRKVSYSPTAYAILTVESKQQCRRADHSLATDDADLDTAAVQLVDSPTGFPGARRHHGRLVVFVTDTGPW